MHKGWKFVKGIGLFYFGDKVKVTISASPSRACKLSICGSGVKLSVYGKLQGIKTVNGRKDVPMSRSEFNIARSIVERLIATSTTVPGWARVHWREVISPLLKGV